MKKKENILYISFHPLNYKGKGILVTSQGIHYFQHGIPKKINWIEINKINIQKGLLHDIILINNCTLFKITRLNRNKFKLLKKMFPILQRLQKISSLQDNNNKIKPLNLIKNELYPEVIPLTLANYFHFLARDENGQCDINLYHSILSLFSNFSRYQKKLVELRLNNISWLSEETIFNQLSNINPLLTSEMRHSILVVSTDILNIRESEEIEKIRSLLKITLKI